MPVYLQTKWWYCSHLWDHEICTNIFRFQNPWFFTTFTKLWSLNVLHILSHPKLCIYCSVCIFAMGFISTTYLGVTLNSSEVMYLRKLKQKKKIWNKI